MDEIKSKLLDEILNCPDIEWKELGSISTLRRGRVMSKTYLIDNSGHYPVFSSQTHNQGEIGKINTYDFDGEFVNWTTDGANAGTVFYRKGKFSITNVSGLVILNDNVNLLYKYLFYWMSIEAKKYVYSGMGNPKLMSHQVEKILIPIPPLPIQQKIVDILDKFTKLTAELTAELTARKQQYEYYRDELLTFDEDDVEWKELKEIAEYSKERISFEELNANNYVGVDNLLQNKKGKTESNYVPTEGNSTKYYSGDILIGNIRPYLKKIWQANCIGGTNGDVLVIHPTIENINPRYLYHILADDKFFDYNMQHARGAKMPRGNKAEILNYKFQLPSLPEQARIVEVLDKFDALTNSLTEGLPREIELRQQQYEYYRDLLLSFPKPDEE